MAHAFGVKSKNILPSSRMKAISSVFLSFQILCFTFKFVMQFH